MRALRDLERFEMNVGEDKLKRMLGILDAFSVQDFKVALGSLLEAKERTWHGERCQDLRKGHLSLYH